MIELPPHWSPRDREGFLLALDFAWTSLDKSRASSTARALFRIVFLQVHHAGQKEHLTRERLAQLLGKSERAVTTALAWLERNDFTFYGHDHSAKDLGAILIRPRFLAPLWAKPAEVSPGRRPLPPRHYKALPSVLRTSGRQLYSDPCAAGGRGSGTTTAGKARGGGLTAAELVPRSLSDLAPPG